MWTIWAYINLSWISMIYIGIVKKEMRHVALGIMYIVAYMLMFKFLDKGLVALFLNIFLACYGIIYVTHIKLLMKDDNNKTLSDLDKKIEYERKIAAEYGVPVSLSPAENEMLALRAAKKAREEQNKITKKLFTVDINHANEIEIAKLPGVGSVFATMAIRFRESKRYFLSPEDFGQAIGLKDDVIEKIAPHIVISFADTATEPPESRAVDA